MAGRLIQEDVSSSDKIASLSPHALSLFLLLIPHYNSHGKMHGEPNFIKGMVCPKISWLTLPLITRCLKEISEKTNVKWFIYKGIYYIHSLSYSSHQPGLRHFGEDKFPSFPGSDIDIGPPLTSALRKYIYTRDTYCCVYCKADLSRTPKRQSIDHVIPLSRGGSHHIENLVTCCKQCNGIKWGKTPEEAKLPIPSWFGKTIAKSDISTGGQRGVNGGSTGGQRGVNIEIEVRSKKGEVLREKKEKHTTLRSARGEVIPPGFEELWEMHPGPKGPKGDALKAYSQIKPPLTAVETMRAQLAYKAECEKRGLFCAQLPHLHRWIRKRRWEDEIPTLPLSPAEQLWQEAQEEKRRANSS